MLYTYKIVKENYVTGERGKRARTITRKAPLTVDGLYCHLGSGLKGFWRVLELTATEQDEELGKEYLHDLRKDR